MKKIETAYALTSLYENYLLERGKENKNERGYSYFHPSAFGGCMRKMALQYFGESRPSLQEPRIIDARVERIFRAGHAHHFRMQSEFSEMGIIRGYWRSKITGKVYGKDNKLGIFRPESLEEVGEVMPDGETRTIGDLFEYEEIQVENKEYNFKGHCDGIIELEKGNENKRFVIDFKTVKSEKFSLISTSSRKPDTEYIAQINIYMWLLGIKQGIIFYEEKNSHQTLEFVLKYDDELVEEIKKSAKLLIKSIEKNQIPKVPERYAKTRKPCIYCGYKDLCYKK